MVSEKRITQLAREIMSGVGLVLLFLNPLSAPELSAGEVPRDVPGEMFHSEADPQQNSGVALKRADPWAPIETEIQLPVLTQAKNSRVRTPKVGTPLQIGVHRDLPLEWRHRIHPAELAWEPLADGSLVATLAVTSPGARAIRIAAQFHSLPPGAEIRFFPADSPHRSLGPYGRDLVMGEGGGGQLFWSPIIRGDSIAIEIFVPNARSVSDVWLTLGKISHVIRSPFERDLEEKAIGDSGSCNKNLACTKKWEMTGESVVLILYEENEAGFLCSGQLINHQNPNRDLQYVLTARHCIGKKKVAKTATFLWFYQRARCNGSLSSDMTQTVGGAKLKFKTPKVGKKHSTDHSLIELKRSPPSGVARSGWSTRDPLLLLNEKVKGIHHPSGDVKMLSKGKVIYVFQLDTFLIQQPFTHLWVEWKKGVTEPGSSGSGLWIGTQWPTQYLVGVLTGGVASCEFKKEPDWYGLFSETWRRHEKFRLLLDPAAN